MVVEYEMYEECSNPKCDYYYSYMVDIPEGAKVFCLHCGSEVGAFPNGVPYHKKDTSKLCVSGKTNAEFGYYQEAMQ
jgi:hypothetical protein